MPALNEDQCADELMEIFQAVTVLTPVEIMHAIPHTRGKLYELYCVGRLLAELTGTHGLSARFTPSGPLQLKASGGYADPSEPHFELYDTSGNLFGRLYTDIEVRTLGAALGQIHGAPVLDLSAHHEIDIVVLTPQHQLSPEPDELLIGIECKAVADFDKAFVREVLGRRRELSFLGHGADPFGNVVMADPGSWYRLVYIDPKGDRYKQSPAFFAVELEHWIPTLPAPGTPQP